MTLTWSANCVITSMKKRVLIKGQQQRDDSPTGASFKITDTKLYAPVVTLSTENDNKLLEQLETGFKRTIKWNKYRLEMSNQAKNNNSNYFIDPTFTKVNRLFVLSFENEEDRFFSTYYLPILFDRKKKIFDTPMKNKEESYEQIIEISRNNDYTAGNLLDHGYFSKHYELIGIDLSKQMKIEKPDLKQQINYVGGLEKKEAATMFFIIEKSEKTIFDFS